ncbi:MAG: GNAT family N-acetyltransferase [Anaerolineae bacterium]|jgi:GNAT superfamily N-acetyltransferase|nr:GNAT family N-acetyltransferase [Anaerolineae bacterium]
MSLIPLILCDLHAAEYDDILALWQRAGLPVRDEGRDAPAAFARQMASGLQRVIGLRVDGKLVAVAVLTHDGRKGWINRLAVDPAYRRQGLARRLVAEAERWFAIDLGLEVWAALIERHNHASLLLFEESGYGQPDVAYVSKRMRHDA